MNLIVKLQNGKVEQVSNIDDFGVQGVLLMCVKSNRFGAQEQRNVAGYNLTTVASYQVDGEVEIGKVVYDSGASVIYDTEVTPAEV